MPPREKQSLATIVGANISRLRQARGLSQREFARMIDMGADSLSRIERGFVAPRFGRLEKFADALCCQVAELFVDASAAQSPPKVLSPQEELRSLTERLGVLVHQISEEQGNRVSRPRSCRIRRPRIRERQHVAAGGCWMEM